LILPLPLHIVAGIVLLAASPAGAISNYYALIARADVALSVTLTAISAAASVVMLPLISVVGFSLLLDHAARMKVPIVPMAIQLTVNILIPVLAGMWLRARFPEFVTRHQTAARRLGNVALVTTVAIFLFGLDLLPLELAWLSVRCCELTAASSSPWRSSSRVATLPLPFLSGSSCSTVRSSRSSVWSCS
jgi:BASS family bile acid:Na+ symporter